MENKSFNVVHLAVALLCLVVLTTITFVINEANQHNGPRIRPSSQLRDIHQGLVTYANSNKEWFPGIDKLGQDEGITVEQRYQILLEGDYFTPEYAISPTETEAIEPWQDQDSPITSANYSYAMLQIPEQEGGRREEWSQTLNSLAIVVSDRNLASKTNPTSIHSERDEPWHGSVLWNDNHVGFEDTDELETKYGSGELNEKDRLFISAGKFDALLIHSGN